MKIYVALAFGILMSTNIKVNGQISWVNNGLKYDIGYVGINYINDTIIVPSKYIILIDLKDEQKSELNSLTVKDWIELLNDEKTDFMANLMLYSIFEKDAIYFLDLSVEQWKEFFKREDIDYWSQYLIANKVFVD